MDFKKFNRPKGANRFCGPAVVSFVTGMHTDDAAALFRERTGKRSVMGTTTGEMLRVLEACGVRFRRLFASTSPRVSPTLAGWLKSSQELRTAGRMFLVSAGHHWQLVSGRRYACGRIGDVVSIRDERVKRRARVREVWELFGEPKVAAHVARFDAARAKRRTENNAAAAARKRVYQLQAEGVCKVDTDDWRSFGHIYVNPGPRFTLDEHDELPGDLYDGCHIGHDWHEALERAEYYAKLHADQNADRGAA